MNFLFNNVEIYKIRGVGGSGTGTNWTSIGTNPVLVNGTCTTLVGTCTIFLLHRWYRYHPCLVPVPVSEITQKWKIFPISLTFVPYSSSIPSYLKNLS